MRTFSYLIVLLGTILLTHHIFAQQVQGNRRWYDQPFIPPIEGLDFEAIGVANGAPNFQGTSRNKKGVHIGDFYYVGGNPTHGVEKLNIDRFWVTSDTLGKVKTFKTSTSKQGSVAIAEYILQVGAQDLDVAGPHRFGRDQEILPKVILTDISVSNETTIDMKGNGKLAANWGLLGNFVVKNYGTIVTADVSGGTFENARKGVVENLNYSGGTLVNASTGIVENLYYSGGTYQDEGGKINALTLAKPSVGNMWGSVGTLMFASKGDGLITLTGFVDEGNELGFTGIDVQEQVNFANGGVVLDMTAVVERFLAESAASPYRRNADWTMDWTTMLRDKFGREAFTAASIFGNIYFKNADASNIAVMWRTESVPEPDPVYIVREGVWQEGWQTESAPTPEPTTLVVFGLGLAGLGLASRRRKE